MEQYKLEKDEVILYKGNVNLLLDGKIKTSKSFKKEEFYLTLTNLHIIINKTAQKLLTKKVDTMVYDVQTVKKYNDTPQIIQNGAFVDVYLLETELFFKFPKKQQAAQFNNAALRLLTGYSKLVRGVKKGQRAIKETEEALNIDISGAAKTAALVSIDMAANSTGKKVNTIGTFAKKFLKKNKEKQIPQAEENTDQQKSDFEHVEC